MEKTLSVLSEGIRGPIVSAATPIVKSWPARKCISGPAFIFMVYYPAGALIRSTKIDWLIATEAEVSLRLLQFMRECATAEEPA